MLRERMPIDVALLLGGLLLGTLAGVVGGRWCAIRPFSRRTRERDVAVMEALVIEGVVLVVLANVLADAFQARLDPRLRRSSP